MTLSSGTRHVPNLTPPPYILELKPSACRASRRGIRALKNGSVGNPPVTYISVWSITQKVKIVKLLIPWAWAPTKVTTTSNLRMRSRITRITSCPVLSCIITCIDTSCTYPPSQVACLACTAYRSNFGSGPWQVECSGRFSKSCHHSNRKSRDYFSIRFFILEQRLT